MLQRLLQKKEQEVATLTSRNEYLESELKNLQTLTTEKNMSIIEKTAIIHENNATIEDLEEANYILKYTLSIYDEIVLQLLKKLYGPEDDSEDENNSEETSNSERDSNVPSGDNDTSVIEKIKSLIEENKQKDVIIKELRKKVSVIDEIKKMATN